jgi:hypothetical protein
MPILSKSYITEIKQTLREVRVKTYTAANYEIIVGDYWIIDRRIVEEIKNGEHQANYGEQAHIKVLVAKSGRGFSGEVFGNRANFIRCFQLYDL